MSSVIETLADAVAHVIGYFQGPVNFYDHTTDNVEFSNFHLCRVRYDGDWYPCVEAAFQAAKTQDRAIKQTLQQLDDSNDGTPGLAGKHQDDRIGHKAWHIGRNIVHINPRWDQVKDNIMEQLIYNKFSGDPDLTGNVDLRHLLIKTPRSRNLVEHTAQNNYWGDGGDGTGQNRLGQIEMRVRSDLINDVARNRFCGSCRTKKMYTDPSTGRLFDKCSRACVVQV